MDSSLQSSVWRADVGVDGVPAGNARLGESVSVLGNGGLLGWRFQTVAGARWQLEATDDLAGRWVPVPDSFAEAKAAGVITWMIRSPTLPGLASEGRTQRPYWRPS